MTAYVRVLAPDGTEWLLGHGDLIGRLPTAALPIDDGRVSEAHGLVSLRAGEWKLLALRGVFAIDGQVVREATLEAGLDIELAPGLSLQVLAVELPDRMLAIEGPGLPRQILTGACSLVVEPRLMLLGRYREDALAHLWSHGQAWRVRLRGEPARDLQAGDRFVVAGHEITAVWVPVDRAGAAGTRVEGSLAMPLRIVASYDTVHVHLHGAGQGPGAGPPVALDGISARILSELVAMRGPVAWEVLAGEIWRDEPDRAQLRRKWDISLVRLRRRLRQGGIRPDLVRAGGTGQVELWLYAGDSVDDRT